ncbi:MAG: Hsp20/alpha crystallin family protein [Planctomycetes bacterium]|nr:Hsp20/alpha crystallin family protein [Planctomycetota bacterium]
MGFTIRTGLEKSCSWEPAADVFITDKRVVIILEAPGISVRDLDVTYEAGTIRVRGYRKHPAENLSPRSFVRMEIPYGFFERSFELPVRCVPDSVEATYKDGLVVIEAVLCRSDPVKEIPIR